MRPVVGCCLLVVIESEKLSVHVMISTLEICVL